MRKLSDDILLRVARVVLTVLLGVTVLVAIGVTATIPILFARRRDVMAELAPYGSQLSTIWWVAVLLALIVAIAVLAFFFLRQLRAIVDSVSQGDPFVEVNAERLRRMAWLTLAIQAVTIPMTWLAVWFDAAPYAPNVHHDTDGISIGALLLALILFILARVFREGTRLRDEVEGTV